MIKPVSCLLFDYKRLPQLLVRNQSKRSMLRMLILLLVIFATMVGYASEIEDLQQELAAIETEYGSNDLTLSQLNKALKDLAILKGKVDAQTAKQQSIVDALKKQLESLGDGNAADPKIVQEKRAALREDLQKNEILLAKYKVLSIATDDRHKEYQERSQTLFKQRLLNRGPNIAELIPQAIAADALMIEVLSQFIVQRHGLGVLSLNDYIALGVWVLLAGIVSYWARRKLKVWSSARRWSDAPFDVFAQGLVVTLLRYLPRLIMSIVLAVFILQFELTIVSASFLQIVVLLLPFYFLARLVVEVVLFPRPPARRVMQLNDDIARLLARWFGVFIAVVYIGAVAFWSINAASPVELTIMLVRDAFIILCVPLLITLLVISGKVKSLEKLRLVRVILIFLLLVVLVFELLGFRNFSYYVLRALFSITMLYGTLRATQWIFSQLVSVLENNAYAISRAVKRTLGLKPAQHIPGLIAFNFFVHASLWVMFFFAAIRALDFSEDVIVTIQNWFVNGFALGNLTINPVRLLFAIVLFSVVYVASGWIKSGIEKKWLAKADIEQGARETIVTIMGYVGVTIALLIGLSVAGVTFTNLAIIAGALSVGIGFGLQNIVNNFVSGLILLFERPIKKGDWIVVGNTEGYVKKISIRSTQIQTFDRSDVIVPNSDLISNQVTNWMLYDKSGRLRVPIGVAYGSDTEKVKNILLELANSHDEVIKNNDEYPIRALFLGFGDSALNFELRCHIKNIDNRLSVLSDMNYKLDAMFREHNVEIPFPQRDIHIRSGNVKDLQAE
jgi:small-conductance mechanosensitive channel